MTHVDHKVGPNLADLAFEELRAQVMELSQQGNNGHAATLLAQHQHRFPEHVYMISYWRIGALCLDDRPDEALQLLRECIHRGMWYDTHWLRGNGDLAGLHVLPEFDEVLALCDEYKSAEVPQVENRRLSYESDVAPSLGLLVALHGNYSNPSAEAVHWRYATRVGFNVLMPQSTQLVAPEKYACMYIWNDQQRGAADVLKGLQQYEQQMDSQNAYRIVGGFSAGASLAIRMATTGSLKVQGFIAVAPGLLDVDELAAQIQGRDLSHLKGYMVVGERDQHSMPILESLVPLLADHGMECRVELHQNLGHAYPEDFQQTLRNALGHLMQS